MMHNIIHSKRGGLTSTEVTLLFVAFLLIAFAIIALVMYYWGSMMTVSEFDDFFN